MKISVVIPALDESDQIAGAVESAAGRKAPTSSMDETPTVGEDRVLVGTEVDVWVVDGGSRDDTVERARTLGARVLCTEPGRARQLQAGFAACDGDIVLFLHADTRLPRGWAEAVRRSLADAGTIGGAFRLRFADRRRLSLRVVEWGARARVALFGMPYGDQAIFVRRSALEALGGVPQSSWMEDLDLVRAMKRRGRLASIRLPATTSTRRYEARGVWPTALRHLMALVAWRLGLDRDRTAAWVRR